MAGTQQEMKGKVLTIAFRHEESAPEMKEDPKPELKTPEMKQEETTSPTAVDEPESEKTLEPEQKDDERRQIDETYLATTASLVTVSI